jgi:drug/metabolite transporter (DMT)-like permease
MFSNFFHSETFSNPNFNSAIIYVVILSFFGTALAKILFNKLVQISTPVFASSVTYLMPIIALIWGVLDGEGFSFLQGLATIIILVGVFLSHKRKQ